MPQFDKWQISFGSEHPSRSNRSSPGHHQVELWGEPDWLQFTHRSAHLFTPPFEIELLFDSDFFLSHNFVFTTGLLSRGDIRLRRYENTVRGLEFGSCISIGWATEKAWNHNHYYAIAQAFCHYMALFRGEFAGPFAYLVRCLTPDQVISWAPINGRYQSRFSLCFG